jgi:hypothetical protein
MIKSTELKGEVDLREPVQGPPRKEWSSPVLGKLPIAATAGAKGAATSDGPPGNKVADAGVVS